VSVRIAELRRCFLGVCAPTQQPTAGDGRKFDNQLVEVLIAIRLGTHWGFLATSVVCMMALAVLFVQGVPAVHMNFAVAGWAFAALLVLTAPGVIFVAHSLQNDFLSIDTPKKKVMLAKSEELNAQAEVAGDEGEGEKAMGLMEQAKGLQKGIDAIDEQLKKIRKKGDEKADGAWAPWFHNQYYKTPNLLEQLLNDQMLHKAKETFRENAPNAGCCKPKAHGCCCCKPPRKDTAAKDVKTALHSAYVRTIVLILFTEVLFGGLVVAWLVGMGSPTSQSPPSSQWW
jgi:hypothetical protein